MRPWRWWLRACMLALLALCAGGAARAHEFKLDAVINAFVQIQPGEARLVVRAPLYLFKQVRFPVANAQIDLDQSGPALERALVALQRDLTLYENGRPLVASSAVGRLSLPSDRSFERYEDALRHIAEPLERGTGIYVDQGYVDARISYPIASPQSEFSIRSTAAPELGDYLKLALRYQPLEGASRAMVFTRRQGVVALNPPWWRAAAAFVGFGIVHILSGLDHLLFLLCLVIPLRGARQLLTVVTGFTLAHSFTLIGSAFGLAPAGAWFPPFVETIIAASIVYMALENVLGASLSRRLLLTMLFGLVHGFGFSYGLGQQLQFAGTHLVVSLFAFNLGIELGQIAVLAAMLPALGLVTRYVLPGRAGSVILAALIAHTAWHWMAERWDELAKVPWPSLDAAGLVVLLLWLGGFAIAGGLAIGVVSRLRLEPAGQG